MLGYDSSKLLSNRYRINIADASRHRSAVSVVDSTKTKSEWSRCDLGCGTDMQFGVRHFRRRPWHGAVRLQHRRHKRTAEETTVKLSVTTKSHIHRKSPRQKPAQEINKNKTQTLSDQSRESVVHRATPSYSDVYKPISTSGHWEFLLSSG
ncbi:hypothetical protein AVEN_82385-1 [Araneus ventricosus]|uniref:Uncharacterized protein n=1 Tax=Araneus ventricosus TaxID=182803 RepID=A0A4Y2HIP8_ARAVE|nr:hypothetical protein AVEN_82385-1 [Araneus ventricosus]